MARNDTSRQIRAIEEAPAALLAGIQLLVTDVDGSLTLDHEIPAAVVQAIADLTANGVEVLPATGRPAAEVHALARYLPGVRRGIAENGAVLVVPEEGFELLWPQPDRQRLVRLGRELAGGDSPLVLTGDHFGRLVDVAFRRSGRQEATLLAMRERAEAAGVQVIWSTVHVHLSEVAPDKGEAVLELARREGLAGAAIATVGDSPNDAGLWRPGRFGMTVGLAAQPAGLGTIPWQPEWLAPAGAEGWLVLAGRLLAARGA